MQAAVNGVSFSSKDSKSFAGSVDGNEVSELVEWLNMLLPQLNIPLEASKEELRTCLIDGLVICSVLNKLRAGSVEMKPRGDNVRSFLSAMDRMGLPRFEVFDLEQGSMDNVLYSLKKLRAHFGNERENAQNDPRQRWDPHPRCLEKTDYFQAGAGADASSFGQLSRASFEKQRGTSLDSKPERVLRCSSVSDPLSTLNHPFVQKLQEVLQMKQENFADLPACKISELIKLNGLDTASSHSLFNVVYRILDESSERKNVEILQRLSCLLRKVVQAIEGRVSAQLDTLRKQNDHYRTRERKYQSRIQALEILATGTNQENEVVQNQLQRMKIEKTKLEDEKKLEELDVVRLRNEKNDSAVENSMLKEELEMTKKSHQDKFLLLEAHAQETEVELKKKLKELDLLLLESRREVKEHEAFSETISQRWKQKELNYRNFINSQFGALQELKITSGTIKQEVLKRQRSYSKELTFLGTKLKGLAAAAGNYHMVLAENRRLYNEVQDLKGNIRVYCRIRPFLPGQSRKQTTIDYIGENGELVVVNPLKQGKDGHRLFKFNKVFSPAATQEEVFLDTQPLIRSVLDGYNVCIFAYGQTGSGKTYTMAGPNISSVEDWGVNYRALSDLFNISQSREGSIIYEVRVQMIEIYNEQVRDLLLTDGSQKRLEIWGITQPNGLAVPDASMHPVRSTRDVLELMNLGLMNRAVGATALNERSSRSHSVLTIHVNGTDMETKAVLRGNLHLVDLAGSERVDRSEATGDRLREAQHINKSLSALGDVIFALAQKSSHVPYRNSKLTQVLQSSLGGQAKTLMFVQLNPDVQSYSETISTLKFAERVSGVELGAAKSNKEGKDVRGLMEQIASLKDAVGRKDEEIERLQMLKLNGSGEKSGMRPLRYGSFSPKRHPLEAQRQSHRLSGGKASAVKKAASDVENHSEQSDKHSEAGSQQSIDDFRNHKDFLQQPKLAGGDSGQNLMEDFELFGFGDADSEERLSDISDGGLSMGTETDGSICSVVEFTLFPETAKPAENMDKSASVPAKFPKPPQKQVKARTSQLPLIRSATKLSSRSKKPTIGSSSESSAGSRKPALGSSSAAKQSKRWQ